MSQEIRGNDNARIVKIISSLMMIASVVVGPIGINLNSNATTLLAFVLFFVGLFGFVVGRFME
jgi:uncharacterized membrane protein